MDSGLECLPAQLRRVSSWARVWLRFVLKKPDFFRHSFLLWLESRGRKQIGLCSVVAFGDLQLLYCPLTGTVSPHDDDNETMEMAAQAEAIRSALTEVASTSEGGSHGGTRKSGGGWTSSEDEGASASEVEGMDEDEAAYAEGKTGDAPMNSDLTQSLDESHLNRYSSNDAWLLCLPACEVLCLLTDSLVREGQSMWAKKHCLPKVQRRSLSKLLLLLLQPTVCILKLPRTMRPLCGIERPTMTSTGG